MVLCFVLSLISVFCVFKPLFSMHYFSVHCWCLCDVPLEFPVCPLVSPVSRFSMFWILISLLHFDLNFPFGYTFYLALVATLFTPHLVQFSSLFSCFFFIFISFGLNNVCLLYPLILPPCVFGHTLAFTSLLQNKLTSIWTHPSIHPFSSAYPVPGRGGSCLSRDAQTSLTPDTSSSFSGRIPRRS